MTMPSVKHDIAVKTTAALLNIFFLYIDCVQPAFADVSFEPCGPYLTSARPVGPSRYCRPEKRPKMEFLPALNSKWFMSSRSPPPSGASVAPLRLRHRVRRRANTSRCGPRRQRRRGLFFAAPVHHVRQRGLNRQPSPRWPFRVLTGRGAPSRCPTDRAPTR